MEKDLQDLLNKERIASTMKLYARGADLRNKEIYRSCFTDKLELDMASVGLGEPYSSTADDWVDRAFDFTSSFHSTQHMITNNEVELLGNEAIHTAYICAVNFTTDEVNTVWGFYTNKVIRVGNEWRIAKLKLTVTAREVRKIQK
mmetsp:Transcript_4863/g.5986  ORF Transcript_4863/g.5986 Transcript_4863/m.5986 type:complete len:145 (-) Transcript_4863:31-465(-)